jgi:putative transposase
MSECVSPATGRRYGVQRVCQAWDFPRSSFYVEQSRAKGTAQKSRRRGPVPTLDDATLVEAIRQDLAESPFRGEGHRMVWARLRVLHDIRTSRKRVLRLMRENDLLSPYRVVQGETVAHDGTIVTTRPDEMWGTDGARVPTADEGWCWIFIAVDHCHGECVGWHVAKLGTRFAALQPLAMGLQRVRGSAERDAGRGIKVRMDHGTQYVAEDFQHQVRAWGMGLSYAFVSEPETNGVAERFIRTLKEQAIHGRIFRTVEDVRHAVGTFIAAYNAQWRLEKNGFLTPIEARAKLTIQEAA